MIFETIDTPDPAITITTPYSVDTIVYSTIPGTHDDKKQGVLNQAIIISKYDIPLTDLPPDDPDKTTDPGMDCLCWESGNLCSKQWDVSIAWPEGEMHPAMTITKTY